MAETDTWETTRQGGSSFHRWVTLHDDGSLTIEGHDLGDTPRDALGGGEYEFCRRVTPAGVARFRQVLGLPADAPLLPALRARFERTADIEQALAEAHIDTDFWSRVGD